MIRIAYIVHSFARGGLERCVARLVNGLDPERFQPLVIALTTTGAAQRWIEREDVPVIEMNKSGGNSWNFNRRLGAVLRRERVDIAHSHNWATLLETSIARRMAGVPVHVHAQRGMFHHGNDDPGWKQWLRRKATRWAINRADCLVTVAESVRDYWLTTFGPTSTPIRVVTNGVDVPDHDPSGNTAAEFRKTLGITPEDFVVGSVGRLVPVKAFDDLIEAMAVLKTNLPHWHLVIVGDGPEKQALRRRAAERGISDRVHLVGEQEDVGNWLRGMQLYVNCSHSEGMSQSVLEAMAMGLPAVVTDVGESRTLVDGQEQCGIVVPPGQPEELARAVKDLAESPETCQRIAQRMRERHLSSYSVSRMVQDYDSLYIDLVMGRRGKTTPLRAVEEVTAV